MGNDIVAIFLDRKRKSTIRASLLFIKYLIDDKAKLNKTIEKIVFVYYRDFYLQEKVDCEELTEYFSIDNLKDDLLKVSLLSTIRFYKESGISEKIKTDIHTIIFLSNALYLSLVLMQVIDKNYEKDYKTWFDIFVRKYQSRLKITEEVKKKEFETELSAFIKKEEAVYRKFFKLLEEGQYQIELEPLLDYSGGYLVRGYYEIKMLSRYSSTEIEQVYQKKEFFLEQFLITLEKLSVHYLQEVLTEKIPSKYFMSMPIEIFEKEKYLEMLDTITKNEAFRSSIVFVFNCKEFTRHSKKLKELVEKGFLLGMKNLEGIDLKPNSFDYAQYVFTTPDFLESHSRNYSFWEDKDIRFILWEGDLS